MPVYVFELLQFASGLYHLCTCLFLVNSLILQGTATFSGFIGLNEACV